MNTNEMSIADVIKLPEFKDELTNQLCTMRSKWIDVRGEVLYRGGVPKRIILDRINGMQVSDIIGEFEKILLRKSDLPSAVRGFISSLCGNVFIKVFSKLKQNEAKQDNNTGKSNE